MKQTSQPFNATLRHIGINGQNRVEAENIARLFSDLFGFAYKPGNSSVFAGSVVEVMNEPYLGRCGHIAFGVDSIEETEAYFTEMGHPFLLSTIKRDNNGRIKAVYLEGDFGGFAVHLLRN